MNSSRFIAPAVIVRVENRNIKPVQNKFHTPSEFPIRNNQSGKTIVRPPKNSMKTIPRIVLDIEFIFSPL